MTGEPDHASPLVTDVDLRLPRGITPARLALGRAGSGLPTRHVLDFAMAHAKARDAVHAACDFASLERHCREGGLDVVTVESAAPDRSVYLRRPDFGRRLSRNARTVLAARPRDPCDVLVTVGDGLSARAIDENAWDVLGVLLPMLREAGRSLGPVVLARQARVALGDEVGAALSARLVLVLIGERPGLSSADSLGAYVTLHPKIGRTDAERNCLSNIRKGGITASDAARSIAWLVDHAFSLGQTGVALKDESGSAALALPGSAA